MRVHGWAKKVGLFLLIAAAQALVGDIATSSIKSAVDSQDVQDIAVVGVWAAVLVGGFVLAYRALGEPATGTPAPVAPVEAKHAPPETEVVRSPTERVLDELKALAERGEELHRDLSALADTPAARDPSIRLKRESDEWVKAVWYALHRYDGHYSDLFGSDYSYQFSRVEPVASKVKGLVENAQAQLTTVYAAIIEATRR